METPEPGESEKVNKGIDYSVQKSLPVRGCSRSGESPETVGFTRPAGDVTPRGSFSSSNVGSPSEGSRQNLIKPMGKKQSHSLLHARTLMTTSIVVDGVEPQLEAQSSGRSSSPRSIRHTPLMFASSPSFGGLDSLSHQDDELSLSGGPLRIPSMRHSQSNVSPMLIPHNKSVRFSSYNSVNDTVISSVRVYHDEDLPETIATTPNQRLVFLCEKPSAGGKKRRRRPLLDSDGRPIPKQKKKTSGGSSSGNNINSDTSETEDDENVINIVQNHRVEAHFPHCLVYSCSIRGLGAECLSSSYDVSSSNNVDNDVLVLGEQSQQNSLDHTGSNGGSELSLDDTMSDSKLNIIHEDVDVLAASPPQRPRRNSVTHGYTDYDVKEGHAFRDARRKEKNPNTEKLMCTFVRKVKSLFEKKQSCSLDIGQLFSAIDELKKKTTVVDEDQLSEELVNEMVNEQEKLSSRSSHSQLSSRLRKEDIDEDSLHMMLEPLLIPKLSMEGNALETCMLQPKQKSAEPECHHEKQVGEKMLSVLHKLIISEDELDRRVQEQLKSPAPENDGNESEEFCVETFETCSQQNRSILKKNTSGDVLVDGGMSPLQAVRARVLMETIGRIIGLRVLRNGIKVAILNDLGVEEERYIWVEDASQICWSTEPLDKHRGFKKLFLKTQKRDVTRVKKISLGTFTKRRGAYSMKPSKYVSWNCITLEFATNVPRIDKSGNPKDGVEMESMLRNIEIVCQDDETTRKVFMGLQTVIPLDKTALTYGAFLWKRAALKARRIAFDKVIDKKIYIQELWDQARELRYNKFRERWKLRERVDAYSFVCAQMSALCATSLWHEKMQEAIRSHKDQGIDSCNIRLRDLLRDQDHQLLCDMLSKVIPPRSVNIADVLNSRKFLKMYIHQKQDCNKQLDWTEMIHLTNDSIHFQNKQTVVDMKARVERIKQLEAEKQEEVKTQLQRTHIDGEPDYVDDNLEGMTNLVTELPDAMCSIVTQKLSEASKLNKEPSKVTVRYTCLCQCNCNNVVAPQKAVTLYTCKYAQIKEAEASKLTELAGGLHKELWHAGGEFISTPASATGRNMNNRSLGGPIPLEAARKMMLNAERTEDQFARLVSFVAFIKALTYPFQSGFEKEFLNETVEFVSLKKEIDELLKNM